MSEVVHGRYDVVRPLGSGAMALVVEARDRHDGRHVALKLLRPMALMQPELVERLRREASTMSTLRHPHVVQFLGFLDHPPVIVLELLQGESVKQVLRRERTLPLHVAATIGAQVASGLAAAHAVGVIHRDVKPSNILVQHTPSLLAKLIDFGVAKHTEPDAPPLTAQSAVIGSALYMSPEQIRGEPAHEASDTFALGLCVYEMVTGERPYEAGTAHLAMVRILAGDPLPEHAALPSGLHHVLLRATAPEPAGRYQAAADLARALQPFCQREVHRTQLSPAVVAPGLEEIEHTLVVPERDESALRTSGALPAPDSATRLDHPRDLPSSSRYGTQPMQSIPMPHANVHFEEPSPSSMTKPLAHLPAELAARLAAAHPPPSNPYPRIPSPLPPGPPSPIPPPPGPPPSGNGWKVALGVSAVAAAAGLAAGGYWLGVHHEAEPPPSSQAAPPSQAAPTPAASASVAPAATASELSPLVASPPASAADGSRKKAAAPRHDSPSPPLQDAR